MRSKRVLDKSLASPRPRLQTGETLPDGSTVSHVVVKNESGGVLGSTETPAAVVNVPDRRVTTIIDDASFTETVTSSDIDMEGYRNAILTVVLGANSDAATMAVSVEVKDSNGNYITFDSLPVMSAGSESAALSLYDLPDTVRVVCTYGGTGNFAGVTVEYTAMN
jgi:hypothetical protein